MNPFIPASALEELKPAAVTLTPNPWLQLALQADVPSVPPASFLPINTNCIKNRNTLDHFYCRTLNDKGISTKESVN